MKQRPVFIHLMDARAWMHGFILFLLIIQASNGFSQSTRVISTKDGLPQSFVSGLVQDDSAFIWIGTRNGLARFDGIQYKLFQHEASDSNSIASNIIIWIQKDRQNRLWVEYESGEIDQVDPVTEKVMHFLKGNTQAPGTVKFVRRGWLVDENGIFWGAVKSGGINTFDRQTKKITFFTRQNAGLPSDTIRGITETRDRKIWILTQHGLSRYDPQIKSFSNILFPLQQDYNNFTESNAEVVDLHERSNGQLMWGDRQHIFFYEPKNKSIRTVALPGLPKYGIRWIRSINDDIEYFESGNDVYRYHEHLGLLHVARVDARTVVSFLMDKSGLIWMGSDAEGLYQVHLSSPFFQSYPTKTDFCTDMMQDLLHININTFFDWTPADNRYTAPGYHLRSAYNKNNRLYIALKETVCYYDGRSKQYIKLPHVPVITGEEEEGIGIKGITIMQNGAPMIIGFNGNILVYDSTSKSWNQFIDPLLLRKTYGSLLLPQDIFADDKNLWITTANDGLLKINIATKQITQRKVDNQPGSLPANQLLGIRQDAFNHNMLWIASYQGLVCLDKEKMHCKVFSQKNGLPDNTIYSLLSDNNGALWFGTNKGLCRLDTKTNDIRIFRAHNGLIDEEFNRFHDLKLPDEKLVFGGTKGWVIFDPIQLSNDGYEPVLALTDIRINNKEISSTNGKELLSQPINSMKQLVLPYDQNTISISFAGLEYNEPQDLKYRYRLQGYDNDWILADNNHQATYTKIPPGTYTLLVNASNTTGKWSKHIKELKLQIKNPWWSTTMAYLCYAIILGGLVYTYIRFRVGRLVMKEEIVLKEKETAQLKELDDMKSRFFSNITHEFRTPLTLIMGPAQQLKAATERDGLQGKLADTIVNNAKQLLTLVNRLLDLSKLEAKALKLVEQRGNPGTVVGAVVDSFDVEAHLREVTLLFDDHTGHMDCWFYADATERIVYNLVSNAVKFTPHGKINVSLAVVGEALELQVKDNGIGISKDELPFIFDRFYQAGDHANDADEKGTGIGLAMVKELVHQMHGDIEAKSQTTQPSGTTFIVTMPFRMCEENDAAVTTPDSITAENLEDQENGTQSNKSARILIIEDNKELAAFISGILAEKYEVEHAINGALGIEAALHSMPDLIVSDVMMPVMDGFEMTAKLKEDIRTSHIPIILLTAKVTHDNVIEGLEKGANDYLTKPFHPTELSLRIQNILAGQQKLREKIQQELSVPEAIAATPAEPKVLDIFLVKLYELLDEHIDDEGFGVDQLTDHMAMSRSSLHRKLKSLTNLSTTEVVRNYRLKKAAEFLKQGFNSSDAAYKTGFGSPAYFTKCFREVYGLTPGDYIRQYKGQDAS